MNEFKCKQCGGCCGPVPLAKTELTQVKTIIKLTSPSELERLKSQPREPLTCILFDTEGKRCSVYSSRPLVCRQYGQVKELQCPNNPGLRLKSGRKEFEKVAIGKVVGILSVNIGWKELESI